jgi:hypothetical protein
MSKDYCKATICSLGFFGLFTAINSAINLSSKMLENDGYDKLGIYSNAILYFSIAIGSVVSTDAMNKIGVRLIMAIGGLICLPYMAAFIFPPLKH